MATSANQLAKSGKFGDLQRRLVFLILALVVYRIGTHVPVRDTTLRSAAARGCEASPAWLAEARLPRLSPA